MMNEPLSGCLGCGVAVVGWSTTSSQIYSPKTQHRHTNTRARHRTACLTALCRAGRTAT